MRLLSIILFAFSHFLVIIFVINIFCIIQTLRQVYSHIKGERRTILDLFFIFYHPHINHIKFKKKTQLVIQRQQTLFQRTFRSSAKTYFKLINRKGRDII